MSTELDAVAKSLLLGRVPELWLRKSFPSLKPLAAYVKEVCSCLSGLRLLLDETWNLNQHEHILNPNLLQKLPLINLEGPAHEFSHCNNHSSNLLPYAG